MKEYTKDEILTLIDHFVEYLKRINEEDLNQFEPTAHQMIKEINQISLNYPVWRPELIKYTFDATISIVEKGLLHKGSRQKPFGYTGDFLNMDYVMTYSTEAQGEGKLWDEFYHRMPASFAVRNRKDFFYDKILEIYQNLERKISVLDVVGGSCRDVKDALEKLGERAYGSYFHFVDSDPKALAYAQELINKVENIDKIKTEWTEKLIYRLKPTQKYDFIWCLGLFDYLKDKSAVTLIKNLFEWTENGGKIIFGNFHTSDPSQYWFEWIMDWILIYRTEEELRSLCHNAGIPGNAVSIENEPLGITLFCIINK